MQGLTAKLRDILKGYTHSIKEKDLRHANAGFMVNRLEWENKIVEMVHTAPRRRG